MHSAAILTTVAALATLSFASPSPSRFSKTRVAARGEIVARSQNAKKGICYNTLALPDALGGAIGWAYNWDSTSAGLPSGVAYYPQLWSDASDHTTQWNANAEAALDNGAVALLGFNEPDNSGQADMTPAEAVTAWNTYIQQYSGRATLVSPAITNGGAAWMTSFLSLCTGCTIDAVATHWYDLATNTAYFYSYLEDLHTSTGKDIWLTEFMGSGTEDEQNTFLLAVLPWLDAQSWIIKYAAFAVSGDYANILVDTSGNVTPLGVTYYNTN